MARFAMVALLSWSCTTLWAIRPLGYQHATLGRKGGDLVTSKQDTDGHITSMHTPTDYEGTVLIQGKVQRSVVQEESDRGEPSAEVQGVHDESSSSAEGSASFQVSAGPYLHDNGILSTPALLASLIHKVSTAFTQVRTPRSDTPTVSLFQDRTNSAIHGSIDDSMDTNFGAVFLSLLAYLCGVLILWFNEIRSVKTDTLLSRGLSECMSIDTKQKLAEETLGRLIHVQGPIIANASVQDPQFHNAVLKNCIKLQSTIEVFEWVQTVKLPRTDSEAPPTGLSSPASSVRGQDSKKIQYAFHKEWTTVHRNSLQFQRNVGKPSPDNPKPPRGLSLGTFTTVCNSVTLGGFILPDDMTQQFHKFEPAMQYLPPTLQACGVAFYANQDGYFYCRPRSPGMFAKSGPTIEPMAGDVRVRFLCVPEGTATAVAVHCETAGVDTFVPYRAIPRGCCSNDLSDRQRLIEEGSRSLQEIKYRDQDMAPCITSNRMTATCFCCPCSTINRVCTKGEVVTEQIYYVSEELDPIEKAFDYVVPRNHFRVWMFRWLGWLVCYLTCMVFLNSFKQEIEDAYIMRAYGHWAIAVLSAIIATSCSSLVISIAYICYSPSQSMKWALAMVVVIALPFIVARVDTTLK
jgi:hypothetical protein